MLSHVIAVNNVGQRKGQVLVGYLPQVFPFRMVTSNRIKAPGPAKVEPIEVYEVAIGAVAYLSRRHRISGRFHERRQKLGKPLVKFFFREHPAHQVGFFQTRR